jgi:hypothetical protein
MNRTGSTTRQPMGSIPVPAAPPVWTAPSPGQYAITLRIDATALGSWVETRRHAESGAPSALGHPPQREGEAGDGFASRASQRLVNSMKEFRKYGGADGTRTRAKPNKISKLLNRKGPKSPFDPYDPQVLHQISHYLQAPQPRLCRPSRHCS